MKFEHLVQITDFMNPLIDPLTREQLWAGLVKSVEDPAMFLPGVESVAVLGRGPGWLEREVRFGRSCVRDRVTFSGEEHLTCHVASTASTPEALRTVAIEEKPPGDLYLRFRYELRPQGHARVTEEEAAFLRQAWLRSDIDLVAAIRRLTAH